MSELLTYLLNNEPQFRKNRLGALYSDFSSLSSTNPDGYTANLSAWRTGLSHASLAGAVPSNPPSRLMLQLDTELLQALESKEWGSPLGLGAVVSDALTRREWIDEKAYKELRGSVYQHSWWPSIRIPRPGEVVFWGLRQLGISFSSDNRPKGKVVVLSNLESAGKEVQRRFEAVAKGRTERIFSRQKFRDVFGDVLGGSMLSEADIEILLLFLSRDKGVLVYDEQTVKFLNPNEKRGHGSRITQEDSTVASLKSLIEDLEIQIQVLEKRVDVLALQAKDAVGRKNRMGALSALRSKKLAENTLEKRRATLVQLEEVFGKIEQAVDQVELVRVMEASSKVMAGLNKEVGGVERVEGVVERLREEMQNVDEVGEVVAEVGREGVDEGEVDDELEIMEREDRERREVVEKKEREEREKVEAEETSKKLAALESIEREARDKENVRKQAETNTDSELDKSVDELKRMSLDPPVTEPA